MADGQENVRLDLRSGKGIAIDTNAVFSGVLEGVGDV